MLFYYISYHKLLLQVFFANKRGETGKRDKVLSLGLPQFSIMLTQHKPGHYMSHYYYYLSYKEQAVNADYVI